MLSVLVALVAASCTGGAQPVAPAVTAVEIAGGDRTLGVGDTVQLSAAVTAVGGASAALSWSSGNDAVATVGASGLVTAVAAGTAGITATSAFDGTVGDSIVVTVTEVDTSVRWGTARWGQASWGP
jgi:uncharacterized protein YjdB